MWNAESFSFSNRLWAIVAESNVAPNLIMLLYKIFIRTRKNNTWLIITVKYFQEKNIFYAHVFWKILKIFGISAGTFQHYISINLIFLSRNIRLFIFEKIVWDKHFCTNKNPTRKFRFSTPLGIKSLDYGYGSTCDHNKHIWIYLKVHVKYQRP